MQYKIDKDKYNVSDEQHEEILNRIDDFYGEEYLESYEFIELYERYLKEIDC